MTKIIKQIVSDAVIKARSYGYGNTLKYITIHETDNEYRGADASAHANLQSQLNPRAASWHYQVDDSAMIQSFPDTVQCWAAGDGRNSGNMESIHIEICVDRGGDFHKAVQNAADLTNYLMTKYNIPIERVVQHYQWNKKNCPRRLRSGSFGIDWTDFINLIHGSKPIIENIKNPTTSTPDPNSIVDYLNDQNMDSSFNNRKKLALQYGILNYTGTASQNIQLLNSLKDKNSLAPKPNQQAISIVDWMKSHGMDASFINRRVLATKYGIKNYTGTASQNLELLDFLKNTQETYSIVDWMKSRGMDASFNNRKALATQYGIKNYTGTAIQNMQLLNVLKKK